MNKTIVVVDSKLMAYTASFQRGENIVETLVSIEQAIKCAVDSRTIIGDYEVIMGFDFGKSRYRKELLPIYKGHRTEGHKDKTEEEMKAYNDFQRDYRFTLPLMTKALGVRVLGVEGVEYDDLASILAYSKAFANNKIIILSEDHDMLQLTLDLPNVTQFMPRSFSHLNYHDTCKLEGVTSKLEFLVAKTVKGDSGDSIMGLKQCGKVCFNKWFEPLMGTDLPYDSWKHNFISLAESKPEYIIHPKYEAIGLKDFGELFDFNMALGETMVDQTKLSIAEKATLQECMVEQVVYNKPALDELLTPFVTTKVNDFGDTLSLPVFTYIRGIGNG